MTMQPGLREPTPGVDFRSRRAIRSGSARARLTAAADFLSGLGPADEALLVGASRGAVDDLAREFAVARGVSFGLHRLSVTQLAARIAIAGLAAENRTPITSLGFEALVTRAAFDAAERGELADLQSVGETPGFARALAATLTELRPHAIGAEPLAALGRRGRDLAALVDGLDALIAAAGATDRAALFDAAIARLGESREFAGAPVVILDARFRIARIKSGLSSDHSGP